MGTDFGLDSDTLSVLDYEASIPCDAKSKTYVCESVAKWQALLSCCGATYFFCDEHMQAHLNALAEGILFSHTTPDGCGTEYIENPFLSIDRI